MKKGPIRGVTCQPEVEPEVEPVSEATILFFSYYIVFKPFWGRRESDYNGPPRLEGIRLKLIQKSFAT